MEEVIGQGGEGVMLRMPKSVYQHGRSYFVQKYKVHHYKQSQPLTTLQQPCNNSRSAHTTHAPYMVYLNK